VSLAGFALRYKTIVVAFVAVLMVWGVLSYRGMPRREDPEYTVRTCQVLTTWPGTPTEKVEELVTAPLEDEINSLDGIRWVRSETTVGASAIYVDLDRSTAGADVAQMWDKVRSRVERVPMPDPSLKPVVIDDFGDTNIMVFALYQEPPPGGDVIPEHSRYSPRDLEIFADRLKNELKLVDGVAKVTIEGVQREAVYIETALGNWSYLGLTTDELQQLISARNVIAPGGEVDTDVGRVTIEPSGDIDAVEQLGSIAIGSVASGDNRVPVYLKDAGLSVVRGYQDPPKSIARFGDGGGVRPAVFVAFTMKSGANLVTVCDDARELVSQLTVGSKVLPPDLGIGIVSDQSANVVRKIDDFVWNVFGAIAIVIVVVFLMVGLRSASVMAANIPLVIIGSLALVTLFGVQLEQISLAAMIIALGMLVDNAVQICDQTRRYLSEGMSAAEAARKGANELAFPILIATGTTIAAFYPMLLGLQGTTKEYIYSLPVTITIVLGLSYVLAMTFCVLLAHWFIKAPEDPNASLSPVIGLWHKLRKAPPKPKREGSDWFSATVRGALRVKWLVVLIAFGSLGVVGMLPVGSEFFPQDIRDQFTIDVWMPEGSSIQRTDVAARQVERIVTTLSPHDQGERLAAMGTVVGKGMPRWYLGRSPETGKPNFAEIVVRTTEGRFTADYCKEIQRIANAGDEALGLEPVVGARVIVRQLMMGPSVDAPIGIRIFAPRLGSGFADARVMREQAARLSAVLRARPGTWDVYDTWGSLGYQLGIDIDPDRANLAGVTNAGVAQSLNAYFSGHYLTTFREGDHQIPVYLRLPPVDRATLAGLGAAKVEGQFGKVPLDSVAKVDPRWDAARIDRRFLQRVIEVRGRNLPGHSANDIVLDLLDSDEFAKWQAGLPPGYWWEVGGELFESRLSKVDLQFSIMISLAAIVLLLIVQYNGIVKPIIILTTLPLALIGALLGLFLTDNPLGFMPQLGLLSLFGIVVNTAIIFLEFADSLINQKIAESDGTGPIQGLTVAEFRECLVKAGKIRLLPIAMTTLTTIGGLLPLALAGGPLWEGMAWLMIFGLIVATVLTLVVVPALYAIFVETLKAKAG